jgi:hypothetical protein
VNSTLSAPHKFEVLNGVRYVRVAWCNPDLLHRFVEEFARWTNERMAFFIFAITRLLSDEHYFCTSGAFAEDCLGGILV